MREFSFSIIDPHGKTWAQLLDVDQPVKLLLPTLADNLKLPRELNYVLIPKASDRPLDPRFTLAQLRVPPGVEMYLRPLRDHLLKMFLDKLYEEVKGYVKDQLMDLAKEKLTQILDLDPAYPDPLSLKQKLVGGLPRPQIQQQSVQKNQVQPKLRSNIGWIIGGILGGGAFLFVVGAIVVYVIFKAMNGASVSDNTNQPVLGTGDVQITLRWDAPVDLDLHVYDPNGEEVWFDHRFSASGGNLDVDANAGCGNMMDSPVENVFWSYGGAPSGYYEVYVIYYKECGYYGPVSYEVTIKLNDQVFNILNGEVSEVGVYQYVAGFDR